MNKECCVLSTVTSAQPWYGDDSPHLPPWIWNRTHHRGVRLLVLATHTDQNLTYGRGPGRTTCYGADLRLRECAFPKHLEYRCCCCVTSASNKWLIRVDLMVARTVTTTTTTSRQSDTSLFHLCGFETKNEVGRRKFGENASIFLNSWPQSSWWIQGLDRR